MHLQLESSVVRVSADAQLVPADGKVAGSKLRHLTGAIVSGVQEPRGIAMSISAGMSSIPRAELAMGNVWDGTKVRKYLRDHGYQLADEV
jgi:hypothetical protein